MWEMKTISDICEIFTDGNWIEKKDQSNDGIRLIQTGNVGEGIFKNRVEKARYINDITFKKLKCTEIFSGDCLISRLPDPVGRACIIPDLNEKLITAVDCSILRFKAGVVSPEFFKYFSLSSNYLKDVDYRCTGSTRKRISRKNLGKVQIPLPPLEEQKRIVAILDEAFAGIDKAKENTEKNLANAKELFESYLNNIFTQKDDGWVERSLTEICEITAKLIDPRDKEYIDLLHLGAGNMMTLSDELVNVKTAREEKLISGKFVFDKGVVLYSKIRPYLMKVCRPDFNGLCSADVYPLMPKRDILERDFLFYMLLCKNFTDYAVKGSARAGMPKVNRTHLFNYKVHIPSIETQKILSQEIDEIYQSSKKLEAIYQQKLTALKELKQSLLQKAFAGELTKPDTVDTTTREYTANIIAIAFARHAKFEKEKTFGHVKTQKLLHLIEAVGGVDLGREPIKDAAGPNDFMHMGKAEEWAKENRFFEFVKRGKGYDFVKLSHFDKYLAQAQDALVEHKDIYTKIIGLLVPLNTRQAELVATVHAAWNNLLLDGKTPSDDDIIHEARENWHSDKREIPRHEFIEALARIRRENIMPQGTGKRVTGQEVLL
ncbi:restriction endonuclease subunit S [Kiloniella spongiae]|uniref:restriction endonuclease subunit S n=1 Tax=Kiloniella spongiae TaxID=1489064 RepID=UPI00069967EE|nr:restriction endonuclease subunit S [Kiloniella spongiae]